MHRRPVSARTEPGHPVLTASLLPGRFDFLDALRGVAALLVLFHHAALFVSPAYFAFTQTYLNLGHTGVIVFFLCSGYIIPQSLERQATLRRFWVRRVCRLYPLYWVSLAAALACYATGVVPIDTRLQPVDALVALTTAPMHTILANAAMVQDFVGVPHLIGVYWTLTMELLFYIVTSIVFLFGGVSGRSGPLAVGFLITSLVLDMLTPGAGILPLYLGIMFCGTVLAGIVRGTLSGRTGLMVVALAVMLVWQPASLRSWDLLAAHLSELVARLLAFAVFAGVLSWRERAMPRWLLGAGSISYSLYLVHPLVMWVVPHVGNGALTVGFWVVATVGLSIATYRWIELPAIALGRRLTATLALPGVASAVLVPAD